MYEIIIQHPAERFIRSLEKGEQKRILDAINQLVEKPRFGKELVGRLAGLRSLHIGKYRVIYKVEDIKLIVLVLRAGYRGNIYSQKMEKWLFNENELKKKMGNIIFSTIRWCDNLDFNPEECIDFAKKAQKKYPKWPQD